MAISMLALTARALRLPIDVLWHAYRGLSWAFDDGPRGTPSALPPAGVDGPRHARDTLRAGFCGALIVSAVIAGGLGLAAAGGAIPPGRAFWMALVATGGATVFSLYAVRAAGRDPSLTWRRAALAQIRAGAVGVSRAAIHVRRGLAAALNRRPLPLTAATGPAKPRPRVPPPHPRIDGIPGTPIDPSSN